MKILIADDHELFLKGLEFILNENFQYPEITTAQSYTDIFSILEQKQDFDLIITDLAMPVAAGTDQDSHFGSGYAHYGHLCRF